MVIAKDESCFVTIDVRESLEAAGFRATRTFIMKWMAAVSTCQRDLETKWSKVGKFFCLHVDSVSAYMCANVKS